MKPKIKNKQIRAKIEKKTAPKKIAGIKKISGARKPKKELIKDTTLFGLHNLNAPRGSHKKKKLLGRGPSSGHGKTSTRGSKGQTSRAGRHFYLGFEGGQSPLIRRVPKRGFTSKFKKEFQLVNIGDLNKIKQTAINPELLKKEGLIKDQNKPVKILGDGEIKSAITLSAQAFSRKAAEKIQGAGGKIEVINAS